MSSAAAGAPLSLPSKEEYLSKRYGDRRDPKDKKKKKHKKEEKTSRRTNGRRGRGGASGRPRSSDSDDDDDDRVVGAHRRRRYGDDDKDDEDDRESEEDRPVIVEGGAHDVDDDRSHRDVNPAGQGRRRYDSDDERDGDDNGAAKHGEAQRAKRRYDSDDDSDDDGGGADRGRRGGRGPLPSPVTSSGVEPPRRRRFDSDDDDDKGREKRRYDSDDDDDGGSNDASDPRGERRTASGHRAGLQSGRAFGKSENRLLRARRDEARRTVDAHGVGETVYRDKSSLRRHDPKGDADPRRTSAAAAGLTPEERAAVLNVGRVQREAMEDRQQRMEQLAVSSFARHDDDEGLEEMRKGAVREGDPMASYAALKRAGGAKSSVSHEARRARPVYKGPPPKPNRYGIRPGFRWDGVDRGNGFEDRLLAKRYNQQHQKELAYRMTSADM